MGSLHCGYQLLCFMEVGYGISHGIGSKSTGRLMPGYIDIFIISNDATRAKGQA